MADDREHRAEEHSRAKAALAEMWSRVATLRGQEYVAALAEYRAEKERVAALGKALRGRPRRVAGTEPSLALLDGGSANDAITTPGLAAEITSTFMEGRLELGEGAPPPGWAGMPEVIVADRMRASGASDPDVRCLLTLAAAMDRARDADVLWFRAERLYSDAPWAFRPEEVGSRRATELADALREHGVSQKHRTDAWAWRILCETLADQRVAPQARAAVVEGHGDARELLTELRTASASGTDLFPLLRGDKIGPMWVRMLAYPGGADIDGLEVVPVAVDTQVKKVSEYLGVTSTGDLEIDEARPVIQRAWGADVRRHGAAGPPALSSTCAAVDPALWFWGKWGCTRCERAGRRVPIGSACQRCRFPARV